MKLESVVLPQIFYNTIYGTSAVTQFWWRHWTHSEKILNVVIYFVREGVKSPSIYNICIALTKACWFPVNVEHLLSAMSKYDFMSEKDVRVECKVRNEIYCSQKAVITVLTWSSGYDRQRLWPADWGSYPESRLALLEEINQKEHIALLPSPPSIKELLFPSFLPLK